MKEAFFLVKENLQEKKTLLKKTFRKEIKTFRKEKMNKECFNEILQTLDNIRTDSDVPKNIRNKIIITINKII